MATNRINTSERENEPSVTHTPKMLRVSWLLAYTLETAVPLLTHALLYTRTHTHSTLIVDRQTYSSSRDRRRDTGGITGRMESRRGNNEKSFQQDMPIVWTSIRVGAPPATPARFICGPVGTLSLDICAGLLWLCRYPLPLSIRVPVVYPPNFSVACPAVLTLPTAAPHVLVFFL